MNSDTLTVSIQKEIIIPTNSVSNQSAVIDSQLPMAANENGVIMVEYVHLRRMPSIRKDITHESFAKVMACGGYIRVRLP